jgi:D-glycero-alpha-D-manno-heptose-7-phosphate kinase
MLWTTRTPLRVSLFGGGTDYPEYFERRPGAVIGFAIDKYIHISLLQLTAFQDYNYRVAYSKLELANRIDEIAHPVVRAVLSDMAITDRLDISIQSDLPATGSGLGSSSAFTVGFINCVSHYIGRPTTKMDLARGAIRAERELLGENVGVQDQLHAAFGGINRFDFEAGRTRITPIQVSAELLAEFESHLVLVHTGIARRATDAVKLQLAATKEQKLDKDLTDLYDLVGVCEKSFEQPSGAFLTELGRMLSESWKIKRGLSSAVSTDDIDDLFKCIENTGAHGAKLCGAGGGGFFLALVPPDRMKALREAVYPRAVIPIRIDVHGTILV